MDFTRTELNEALDELGGRLLANQGPPTREAARRLVLALRQLREAHRAAEERVGLQNAEISRLEGRCTELSALEGKSGLE